MIQVGSAQDLHVFDHRSPSAWAARMLALASSRRFCRSVSLSSWSMAVASVNCCILSVGVFLQTFRSIGSVALLQNIKSNGVNLDEACREVL